MELINKIIEFFLGRKYYANIYNTRGTNRCDISSYIFADKETADIFRARLDGNTSYLFIETISFRSRNKYILANPGGITGTIIL